MRFLSLLLENKLFSLLRTFSCGLEGIVLPKLFPSCSKVSISHNPEIVGFFSCCLTSSVVSVPYLLWIMFGTYILQLAGG